MNKQTLAFFYLLFPFLIFCMGFLRWYVGLPVAIITIGVLFWICSRLKKDEDLVSDSQKWILFTFSLLWCIHAGIGGLWVQHADWFVKNAVLRDLINLSWPLKYDLSLLDSDVQAMIGNDCVGFSYYLFYYLPAALLGRVFSSEIIGNLALLFWSAFGLYLVLSYICGFVFRQIPSNKLLFILLGAIICFSGLEVFGAPVLDLILGDGLRNTWSNIKNFSIAKEMWCWPYFSMYGSLYSDMEIRFNQTIPIWLIMAVLIKNYDNKCIAVCFSFFLLYSPWACIGAFFMGAFILIFDIIRNGIRSIYSYFSIENILFPLLLMATVMPFYLANGNSTTFKGWFFEYLSLWDFFIKYILFILFEIGLYYVFLRKCLSGNLLLQSSFLVLLILPFYRITAANDLLMCASIPAIFVIAVFWFRCLIENINGKFKLAIWIFVLLTGLTPIEWMIAEDYHFLSGQSERMKDSIHSFSELSTDYAILCDQQFFVHNTKDTFFWKYLAK